MAKRKPRAKQSSHEKATKNDPVDSTYDGVDFESFAGVDNKHIFSILMDQIYGSTPEVYRAHVAGQMLGELKPRDMQEGLLCTQMITTHHQLMECYKRAMIPGQTFQARDLALKHGVKLAGLFARQIETLDKHRGKGQQKITVEHFHVHEGGKAMVGNFSSSAADRTHALPEDAPAVLPEPDQEAMPIIKPVKPSETKAIRKK